MTIHMIIHCKMQFFKQYMKNTFKSMYFVKKKKRKASFIKPLMTFPDLNIPIITRGSDFSNIFIKI